MLFRWRFFHCNCWSIANWTSPLFYSLSSFDCNQRPSVHRQFHSITQLSQPCYTPKLVKADLTLRHNISKHRQKQAHTQTEQSHCQSAVSGWEKEIWDLYSQMFWVLCFGLGCLCFVLCVCVVSTSPTGRTCIHHIFDLTKCTHSFQLQAEGVLCPYRDQLVLF